MNIGHWNETFRPDEGCTVILEEVKWNRLVEIGRLSGFSNA